MIRTIELPEDHTHRTPMADEQATALIESALATMPELSGRIWVWMDGWCAGNKTMRLMDAEFMLHFLATGQIQAVEYA